MVEKKRKRKKETQQDLCFLHILSWKAILWLLAFHLSCIEVVRIVKESKINNIVALGKVE